MTATANEKRERLIREHDRLRLIRQCAAREERKRLGLPPINKSRWQRKKERIDRLERLLAVSGMVLAALVIMSANLSAHDYDHPDRSGWYQSLQAKDKTPCCDDAEAKHISDVEWDTTCEQNRVGPLCHYRVFLHNKWWEVPDRAVVEGPNRDGRALVWEVPTKLNNYVVSTFIRCFMPGAGI